MMKINTNEMPEEKSFSDDGKYGASGKDVSIALGRDGDSMDLLKRHSFDIEISRQGKVRDATGTTSVSMGDAFIFKPGEPHQIINDSEGDLVVYVIADNPIGESIYLPDENRWYVKAPSFQKVRPEVHEGK